MNRRTALRTGLIAACLALVVPLTGCVTLFLPPEPERTSTPTGETVAKELEPFYEQVLVWSKCEGTFQCATAKAPLDWSDPARDSIHLALIRSVATGSRIGSLLVNPGGPGGSGYDFIRDSLSYAVSARLSEHYDVVGFDPRGVNKSSAVSCYTDPAEMDDYLYGLSPNPVGSDAWIDDMEKSNAAFGQACLKNTGELLGYVDTESAARDLDLLRAILGDKKLNYLGYSYGTFLGATYAELYPGKTGHLVLDGAIDPATSDFDVTATQAKGFESAARAYLADCFTSKSCPFRGTADEAMARIRSLLQRLDASPLRASDGRMLGSAAMFNAIILPLYSPSNWRYLSDLFTDVLQGNADYAFQLADSYYGRSADGTYQDNSTEAFIAINCLDYMSTSTRATLRSEAAELAGIAPTFGPQMSYGGTSCAQWPFPGKRVRGPIAAAGSAPILVVGTTNDPATPYQWAKNLAGELQNGHLVTYNGEGHTAYNKSNSCVNDAVDNYFIDDKVPAKDPDC
ncbi:MAG TPA: alpha/beta hydrolase [Terrimesophilobacter sp.]|uniref:alpha/beta hydrolase n=1 Tax=Terrimesophilobacter sp. TaxID=2906435 RepID=UPI002F95060A